MMTQKGRVVYNRKVHLFDQKDLARIMKAVKRQETLEVFIHKVVDSLLMTVKVFEEDYVDAFRFSLDSFWMWITGTDPDALGTYGEVYSKTRTLGTTIATIREEALSTPEFKDEIKAILAGFVAEMITVTSNIEEYVEEEL